MYPYMLIKKQDRIMHEKTISQNEVTRLSGVLRNQQKIIDAINKNIKLIQNCLNKIDKNNPTDEEEIKCIAFSNLIKKFSSYLIKISKKKFEVDSYSSKEFNSLPKYIKYANELSIGLEILYNNNLLSSYSVLLIENSPYAIQLSKGLVLLKQANLSNKTNHASLLKYAQYADLVAEGLQILQSINLLENEYKHILTCHPSHANEIAKAMKTLREKNLFQMKYLNYLNKPQVAKYADVFAKGLHLLKQSKILTDNNLIILSKHSEYSIKLATALRILNENKIDVTGSISEIVFNHPLYSDKTSTIISLLNTSGLQATDYINHLKKIINNPYKANIKNNLDNIPKALDKLSKKNNELITAENVELFFLTPHFAKALSEGIVALYDSRILTKENKQKFIDHVVRGSWLTDAERISAGLHITSEEGILTESVFHLLINNSEYIFNFANGLCYLNRAELFNSTNIQRLHNQEIVHRANICTGFIRLGKAKILSEEYFNDLMNYPNIASNLSIGIRALHFSNLLDKQNKYELIKTLQDSNWLVISSIGKSLEELNNYQLLTLKNLKLVFSMRKECKKISDGIIFLHDCYLLNDENRKKFVDFGMNAGEFSSITNSLETLRDANLLTQDNFNLITDQNSLIIFQLSETLVLLNKSKLSVKFYVEKIISSKNIDALIESMKTLFSKNILKNETLDLLIQKISNVIKNDVVVCLNILSFHKILNESNFFKLMHGNTVHKFMKACCCLSSYKRYNGKNLQLILDHPYKMKEIALTLNALYRSYLLTDNNNISFIAAVRSEGHVCEGIQLLNKNSILNQDTFKYLVKNPDHANKLARGFVVLSKFGHLTAENKKILENQAARSHELALGITTLKSKNFIPPNELKKFSKKLIEQPGLGNGLNILSKNDLLTHDNLNFLVKKKFIDCYAIVARTMVLLKGANKLNEINKQKLTNHPHHALLLAKKEGVDFTKQITIYNQLLDIQKTCRILGEGMRDDTHMFSRFDPSLLAKIAFLSSEGDIDKRTAIITGHEFLKKPAANYRRRMLIISFGLIGAFVFGYGGSLLPIKPGPSTKSFQSLEYAAFILFCSFIGLIVGIYSGEQYHISIKAHEEKENQIASLQNSQMQIK